jgi:hypothetical protein
MGVERFESPDVMSPLRTLSFVACVLCPCLALSDPAKSDAPAPSARPPSDSVSVTAAAGKGVTFKTADDKFSLKLRGRIQLRDTYTHTVKPSVFNTNEVQVRTVRVWMQGNTFGPDIQYLLQLAFGGGDFGDNASPVFDAFLEYTAFRDLQIRAGQFLVPFDRLRTIREFALQLVDRPQVVRELTLDRDMGLLLYSNNLFGLGNSLAYSLFVGGGDGRNRFNAVGSGPLFILRAVVRPFGAFDDDLEGDLSREHRPRLAVGIAGAYNIDTTKQQSTYGATFTQGTADYYHAAADLVLKYAGFSLMAEAVWRKSPQTVFVGTVNGATVREYTRSGYGYLVQAGAMVSSRVELVGRYNQLFALTGTDPKLVELARNSGKEVTAGVNWYLNGHALKLQADYSYIFGASGQNKSFARLQLDATF